MRPLLALPLLLIACRADPKNGGDSVDLDTVDGDGDGHPASEDCDDADAAINADAEEICDGVDNDCDGETDEELGSLVFTDADGDGHGDPATGTTVCSPELDQVADDGDCDDTDPTVNPSVAERCDGVDRDCDGTVDGPTSVDADTWFRDADGDGHGDPAQPAPDCEAPAGFVASDSDCDDTDPAVSPDATELCDGIDNDCDGQTDEDSAVDAPTWYADEDADGHGDPAVTTRACSEPSGFTASSDDCDDTRGEVSPSAAELCDGATDEDCDGQVDEPDAADAPTWYADTDGDGFGASTSGSTTACDEPSGYRATDDDCDDGDAAVSPDADERCDGIDNDCDGSTDEDSAVDAPTWYADTDGDGFGDAGAPSSSCSQPSGTSDDATDCDDGEATAYPGSTSTETPGDGIDQDCDGIDACTDLDCDGLPDLVTTTHYGGAYTSTSFLYYGGDGFSEAGRTGVSSSGAYDSEVGDFDGDGYQDVAIANYYDGSSRSIDSRVYWGSAAGHSTADRTDLPTVGTVDVLADDLDADGYTDLVFTSYASDSSFSGNNNRIYWGSATGFSAADRTDLPSAGSWQTLAEDFDQDGYTDLAFCNYYSGAYAIDSVVYWGGATGFSSADRTDLPTAGCRDVAAADLNGDGYSDLVFANYYSGSTYSTSSRVYYGSASGFSTAYVDDLPTQGTLSVSTGDFDGDGLTDVAFGGYFTGGWTRTAYTRVFWNSSLGLSGAVYTDLGTRGIYNTTAADLDGDGVDELIGARYYTGSGHSGSSHIWWGSASGMSDADRTDLPTTGAGHPSVGDLDGDGVPEVAFSAYYGGSWSSYVDDRVYWGDPSEPDLYDPSDLVELDTYGTWGRIGFVGNTDW